MTREDILRDYYAGWEKKDWTSLNRLLTDYFTFTSPNGDDHINRAAFYAKCWPEAPWVDRFELESVAAGENDAFVRYLCHTRDGRSFRNVEYFCFSGQKIASIECYFGGSQGYPSHHASIEDRERILGTAG